MWCEVQFLNRVSQYDCRAAAVSKLAHQQYMFRMMDDILICNDPDLAQLAMRQPTDDYMLRTDWIYPAALTVSPAYVASRPGDHVVYLDISLTLTDTGVCDTRTFFKASKLPTPPIQYISPFSCRPLRNCNNIIVGLTDSAVLHASSTTLAYQDLMILNAVLQGRGFKAKDIKSVMLRRLSLQELFPGIPFCLSDLRRLIRRKVL